MAVVALEGANRGDRADRTAVSGSARDSARRLRSGRRVRRSRAGRPGHCGGARGLGRTMAAALAEAGADIALAGRSKDTCQDAANGIGSATGRTAKAFAADVTKIAEVERLADDVEREFGRVDILVNNAGIN